MPIPAQFRFTRAVLRLARGISTGALLGALMVQAAPTSVAVGGAAACSSQPWTSAPLALADGQWSGVVVFDGAPVRFALEVDHLFAAATPVRIGCASRLASVPAATSAGARVTLVIDEATGERLEGEVAGKSFVGYYFAPADSDALGREFPFRASLQPPTPAVADAPTDFGGEWIFTLRSADGRVRMATALVSQGREKLYAIWREADGTRRFLSGLPGGDRLVLQEMVRGPGLVFGRSDAVTGEVKGELIEPSGRTAFTAQRKAIRRIMNLAGLE